MKKTKQANTPVVKPFSETMKSLEKYRTSYRHQIALIDLMKENIKFGRFEYEVHIAENDPKRRALCARNKNLKEAVRELLAKVREHHNPTADHLHTVQLFCVGGMGYYVMLMAVLPTDATALYRSAGGEVETSFQLHSRATLAPRFPMIYEGQNMPCAWYAV